jgi:hypothetical protein
MREHSLNSRSTLNKLGIVGTRKSSAALAPFCLMIAQTDLRGKKFIEYKLRVAFISDNSVLNIFPSINI